MQTSKTYSIGGDKTLTVQNASCPSGFYVRPTPPPTMFPTDGLSPAVWLSVSNGSSHVYVDGTTPGTRYGQGAFAPFSDFTVKFRSDTPDAHTLTFSWWCDAIAPWMNFTTDQAQSQISPPTPNNPYASYQSTALTNDATGLVLNDANTATTEGNPIITWPNSAGASNQAWYFNSGGVLHDIPVYALWLGNGGGSGTTIRLAQENTTSHQVALHNTQGAVPSGGSWYYLDTIPGPNSANVGKLDVMLINTTTNQCLAGPSQQGTQVQTLACNTTDKSQWWTVTQGTH